MRIIDDFLAWMSDMAEYNPRLWVALIVLLILLIIMVMAAGYSALTGEPFPMQPRPLQLPTSQSI